MNTKTIRSTFVLLSHIVLLVASMMVFVVVALADSNETNHATPNRIVGGQPAEPGAYPYTVSLMIPDESALNMAHFCGGSLIAADWVLTAAHCVADDPEQIIDVGIGLHHLRADKGERIQSQAIYIHPTYEGQEIPNNDIALIHLARPVDNPSVASYATSDPPSGTELVITGWGNTHGEAFIFSPALHEASVPMISTADCRNTMNGDTITDTMLCAGVPEGGVDSCQGDSGGPLVLRDGDNFVQVGIISWGDGCGVAGSPGVYTRVSHFAEWINSYLSGNPPAEIYAPTSASGEMFYIDGEITTVADDSITVEALDGSGSQSVSITVETEIYDELAVGQFVFMSVITDQNEQLEATFIGVFPTLFDGEITAVSSDSVTIKTLEGSQSVAMTEFSIVQEGVLAVGNLVSAEAFEFEGEFEAALIQYQTVEVDGKIVAVEENAIIVETADGDERAAIINDTFVQGDGFAVGNNVFVDANRRAGQLVANYVYVTSEPGGGSEATAVALNGVGVGGEITSLTHLILISTLILMAGTAVSTHKSD